MLGFWSLSDFQLGELVLTYLQTRSTYNHVQSTSYISGGSLYLGYCYLFFSCQSH